MLTVKQVSKSSSSVTPSGLTKKLGLRIGRIESVDKEKNKISVSWLYPMPGGQDDINISSPYMGFRSGIRFVPEVGSNVTVGFIGTYPMLLSYALPADFDKMIQQLETRDGEPTYIKDLNPGEISITSKQNAEIYFNEDVTIKDSENDTIILKAEDNSINLSSLQLYINNEAGKMTMGMVKRDGGIITDDGQSVVAPTGGNALTEFKLEIMEFADASINSGTVKNSKLAEITVGTITDETGLKTQSKFEEDIALEIKMSSGIKVQFDKAGNMSVDGPAYLTVNAKAVNINDGYKDKAETLADPSQQRAAREGDRVTIPLSFLLPPDQVHPGLNLQGILNYATMAQLAASFMSPVGPCTFIPVPNLKLFGQITQGSSDVFIGSNDKLAELQENLNNS